MLIWIVTRDLLSSVISCVLCLMLKGAQHLPGLICSAIFILLMGSSQCVVHPVFMISLISYFTLNHINVEFKKKKLYLVTGFYIGIQNPRFSDTKLSFWRPRIVFCSALASASCHCFWRTANLSSSLESAVTVDPQRVVTTDWVQKQNKTAHGEIEADHRKMENYWSHIPPF